MKASKQHFELVERVLRTARETQAFTPDLTVTETLDAMCVLFANAFEASNKSGFDRTRFLKGCGYTHPTQHTAPRDPRPIANLPTPLAIELVNTILGQQSHDRTQLRGSETWQHFPATCERCQNERKAQEVLDAHARRTITAS